MLQSATIKEKQDKRVVTRECGFQGKLFKLWLYANGDNLGKSENLIMSQKQNGDFRRQSLGS